MKISSLFAVLIGAAATRAMGCDLCAIYSATQARGESGHGPFLGVAEQFTHFGTLQDEGREVPNQTGQYLNSSISQVFAGYNFTERFGLQFNLPVIYRSFKRPDGMGGIDRGTESGLGDVSLLGSFVGYRKLTEQSTFSWSIVGGVKFPTRIVQREGGYPVLDVTITDVKPNAAVTSRTDATTPRKTVWAARSGSWSCQASKPVTTAPPITGQTRKPNCLPMTNNATRPAMPTTIGNRNHHTQPRTNQ